jgi:hypothetical protein
MPSSHTAPLLAGKMPLVLARVSAYGVSADSDRPRIVTAGTQAGSVPGGIQFPSDSSDQHMLTAWLHQGRWASLSGCD